MKLEEAAANIGRGVIYAPRHGAVETGVIKAVGSRFVHVAYGNQTTAKATSPGDLILMNPNESE